MCDTVNINDISQSVRDFIKKYNKSDYSVIVDEINNDHFRFPYFSNRTKDGKILNYLFWLICINEKNIPIYREIIFKNLFKLNLDFDSISRDQNISKEELKEYAVSHFDLYKRSKQRNVTI